VAVILREGETPTGVEVRTILKRVIARIRRHGPRVHILVRGDSQYGQLEVMDRCESNGVDYIFGFSGNLVLHAMVRPVADELCARRAITVAEKRRSWKALRYGAKSWGTQRRMVAGIEAVTLASISASLSPRCPGRCLYETVYCGRGQTENFIKLHKAQLASDRTSCRDPRANQMRLISHTAAYWLLHTLRAAAPKRSVWARAEFNTLRLIKIAGRVVEGTTRIRVWLPTVCLDGATFKLLAGRFAAAGP
jgi:Transposase DDE domain group 1